MSHSISSLPLAKVFQKHTNVKIQSFNLIHNHTKLKIPVCECLLRHSCSSKESSRHPSNELVWHPDNTCTFPLSPTVIRHTHHLPAREEEGILSVNWVLLLLVLAYFKRIPNDWLSQTLKVEKFYLVSMSSR